MNVELNAKLKELGLTDDQITKLETEGVIEAGDMAMLSAEELVAITACGLVTAKKIVKAFLSPSATPVEAEISEGKTPSAAQVNDFASSVGMDPSMLMMVLMGNFASGSGIDVDLSGMMPIPAIVAGYNPKIRNINYLVMGQLERRLECPIVVINPDGAVNPDLTVKYIMSLEEGFEPAADNVHYDEGGDPYEVIKVGVDAQSIYDADPLDSTRALQKNGMGIGRINWYGVQLEVRQVVYYAANTTGEITVGDEAKLSWLRANIKPTTTRLNLRTEFPKALNMWNEAARTGSLPTLRVQLSRTPRRKETMPRRRPLSGGESGTSGSGFRDG